MKKILWSLLSILMAAPLCAQTNAPVRLALVAETPDAASACDLLTVEFSKNPGVQLLERNEIDKAYREQALSAANRDYLKLGQVLGADGLLLVKADTTSSAPPLQAAFAQMTLLKPKFNFSIRLIAVKPGALLANERFSGVEDVAQWAEGLIPHLNPLLPKLSVLVKDAVPISIVNVRAAMQSPETKELEKQLTSLAIERLSHEKQLFVLERQKMQLLASEKELKGLTDSAFWNGSYLLDGTIDRNGYSADKLTLSVRLSPPYGGAPVNIEITSSRTNLAAIVNQLTEKVCEQLRVGQTATAWDSSDEAQQFFEEAKWALKWKLIDGAQNASDAAWALGKQDLDCATVRVKAYLAELKGAVVTYQKSEASISSGFNRDGTSHGPSPTDAEVQQMVKDRIKDFPFGAVYREERNISNRSARVCFSFAQSLPQEVNIDRAMHVLELYYNFSRTHSEGQPQLGTDATGWRPPEWTSVGIDALTTASQVLRDQHFVFDSRKPLPPKLAELRTLARSAAKLFTTSPSIRDGYFVDGRTPANDTLLETLQEHPSIFACEVNWGCFWQEKPADTLAFYRELMSSPAFCYIHKDFWERDLAQPRLVGWTDEDRHQIPDLWSGFMRELNASTNVLLQMEASALEKVDAKTEEQAQAATTNWWALVRSHRAELITNSVNLFHMGWGFAYTEETREIEQEYWSKTVPTLHMAAVVQRQKRYLAAFVPYDFSTFNDIFGEKRYTREQAAELKPLVAAYRSNILTHATTTDFKAPEQRAASWIKSTVEDSLDRILNAKPETNQVVQAANHTPLPPAPAITPAPPAIPVPAQSNLLVVKKFLRIPKGQLPDQNLTNLVVFGHRVRDDKLLLDLRYEDQWWEQESNSSRLRTVYHEAAAILNSIGGGWEMVSSPHSENSFAGASDFWEGNFGISGALGSKAYIEMFENALYVSDRDAIRRYDLKQKQWSELPFPGQARAQLFAINGHLYASSPEGIWEILDAGRSAKILASTRRRPAASSLDSRDSLGKPMLFPGRENTLWAASGGEVFSWDGTDWKTVLTIPGLVIPEIHEHTAFFWTEEFPQPFSLWRLSPEDAEPVLCMREVLKNPSTIRGSPPPEYTRGAKPPRPLWKLPEDARVARSSVIIDGTSIWLTAIPVDGRNSWTSDTMAEDARRGLQPKLLCLLPGIPEPFMITLRFDSTIGPMPVLNRMAPGGSIWTESSSEYLFIGSSPLGVWVLPKAEIRAELDRQIKNRPAASQSASTNQSPEQTEKALLAKYDLNHNGQIDLEEREAAISDPVFLKFNLNNIDTNHNGMLDVGELEYFDANKNRHMDPLEESGYHTVQQILAEAALEQFDWDGDGRLESWEYGEFTRGKTFGPGIQQNLFRPAGSEMERLKNCLEAATRSSLQDKLLHMGINSRTFLGFNRPPNDPTFLREEIGLYWGYRKSGM
jgi:hypothetical protein